MMTNQGPVELTPIQTHIEQALDRPATLKFRISYKANDKI
jgi:hypothetical protein